MSPRSSRRDATADVMVPRGRRDAPGHLLPLA